LVMLYGASQERAGEIDESEVLPPPVWPKG
jgi:hypothetical protein